MLHQCPRRSSNTIHFGRIGWCSMHGEPFTPLVSPGRSAADQKEQSECSTATCRCPRVDQCGSEDRQVRRKNPLSASFLRPACDVRRRLGGGRHRFEFILIRGREQQRSGRRGKLRKWSWCNGRKQKWIGRSCPRIWIWLGTCLSREVRIEAPRVWWPEGIYWRRPRRLELGNVLLRNYRKRGGQQKSAIRTRQRHGQFS
jgi:hypothetical protein